MGVVEEIGSEVQTLKRGDRVIAPYDFCDGTCEFCQQGLDSACEQGGLWGFGHEGGQAEAIRARFADATLLVLPPSVERDEALLQAILPLTDVVAAGHHASLAAEVRLGKVAVIIGDGAVGLCGVLAAHRLGAEQIIILGHQPKRLALARQFGATDIITNRGDEAVQQVIEMTQGGAHSILECVGSDESLQDIDGEPYRMTFLLQQNGDGSWRYNGGGTSSDMQNQWSKIFAPVRDHPLLFLGTQGTGEGGQQYLQTSYGDVIDNGFQVERVRLVNEAGQALEDVVEDGYVFFACKPEEQVQLPMQAELYDRQGKLVWRQKIPDDGLPPWLKFKHQR